MSYTYTNSTQFLSLLDALVKEFDTLEQLFGSLILSRGLNTSFGAQLDGIGIIVGEPRNSLPDEAYRSAIKYKISLNSSGGQIETIITFVQRATGALKVSLSELGNANVGITILGGNIFPELRSQIDRLLAGGVAIEWVVQDQVDRFVWSAEDSTGFEFDNPDGLGFDEENSIYRGGHLNELYS